MDFAYFLIALVAIAINVAFAMYAGGITEQKGYSKGNWIAVCIIFGIIGYILIAALPDLELRATLENIEKKLAKDKNDNYLPRSSSSDSNRNSNSSNSNSTIKSLSKMTTLAPLSDSMDYWTCKYCGLDNPKEARYCQHCGGYR